MNSLNKRNPIIAGLLSLYIGPFGYAYIRPNFMLSGIIISILFTIVLSFINLPFPHFFTYLQLLVYGYYGCKLLIIRNVFADDCGVTDDDVKEFKSFGFRFVIMTNILIALTQFYLTIVGF